MTAGTQIDPASVTDVRETQNIGRAKYCVSYHRAGATHPDGSDFYDLRIFRNKKAKDRFIRSLQTRVLFRADRSGPHRGAVTAVFPDLPFDADGAQLTCYMHVGQHSGCTWRWVREVTRPATETEYADLARELTARGYRLKIVTRR